MESTFKYQRGTPKMTKQTRRILRHAPFAQKSDGLSGRPRLEMPPIRISRHTRVPRAIGGLCAETVPFDRMIHKYFAVAARGIERVTAAELEQLGAQQVNPVFGGVHFEGDML